jgi:hypothetical protein
MPDYKALENQFQQILNLNRRPVAVAFRDEAPATVEKFSGSEPAGCSFWRLAAEGRTFSTVPSDHYNCPIGSYTHNIPLPKGRAHELPEVLETMVSLGYLKMDEVPAIPRLPETPKNIVVAPLGDTPVEPDVVLFVAAASKLMLLEEAAIRAGSWSKLPLLARPTCMAIPAAMAHGMVSSEIAFILRSATIRCTPQSRGARWNRSRVSWRPSLPPIWHWRNIIANGSNGFRRYKWTACSSAGEWRGAPR